MIIIIIVGKLCLSVEILVYIGKSLLYFKRLIIYKSGIEYINIYCKRICVLVLMNLWPYY